MLQTASSFNACAGLRRDVLTNADTHFFKYAGFGFGLVWFLGVFFVLFFFSVPQRLSTESVM